MNDQLSMLPDLDRASDTRKANLCRSWKNAVLNEFGVFIDNRIDIVVYKNTKKIYPCVTIHCALEYPKVYYSFDVMGNTAGGGGYPGRDSHNFDVHEHAANVALMVEHELRDRVKSYEITDKMIDECIEKFKAAIMSDRETINGVCKRCGIEIMESLMEHGLCPACHSSRSGRSFTGTRSRSRSLCTAASAGRQTSAPTWAWSGTTCTSAGSAWQG